MRFWLKILLCQSNNDARWLLSELANKVWKLGSIDSLLKRIRKTDTIVRQPGSGTADRVRRVAVEDLVLSSPVRDRRSTTVPHSLVASHHSRIVRVTTAFVVVVMDTHESSLPRVWSTRHDESSPPLLSFSLISVFNSSQFHFATKHLAQAFRSVHSFHAQPTNEINLHCNNTFIDVHFTLLLAKNI